MGIGDRYPTIAEIQRGQAPFDVPAYHDEATGMYTAADVEPATVPDMIKDETSGLFLPKPKHKQVTRMHFDTGLVSDVSESWEEVDAAIKEHTGKGDLRFSGPVFPDEPVIIRSAHVKRIMLITVDYRDLEEIELAIKVKEHNMRMARSQNLGRLPKVR